MVKTVKQAYTDRIYDKMDTRQKWDFCFYWRKDGYKTPESTWEGRRTVCKYQAKLFIIIHFHKVIAISSFEVLKECIEKVSAENKIHN